MKHIIPVFYLIVSASTLLSQNPSPDFMITDSDNVTHQLYADHLDQGQAVLVEIFFTTCPPCHTISPFMEPFYQEWGGGSSVVEFFSLSNKNFDNNVDVAAYKIAYGQTFPSAGNDGGSLEAIVPYTDGTYGLFIGTPTFIVIAPDGTVTYNPFGPNIESRFNAIDQALRATGVAKPAVPHQFAGTILTPDSLSVTEVDLIIPDTDTLLAQGDEDGLFNIEMNLVARDDYILKGQKNDNHREGISIRDLVAIHKHILGIDPLDSPYQLLAADADHSGSITTQDILQLRKLILHIEDELQENVSWLFIDAEYEFNDPSDPFPEIYESSEALIHFTAKQDLEFHLLGIKIGDVK